MAVFAGYIYNNDYETYSFEQFSKRTIYELPRGSALKI